MTRVARVAPSTTTWRRPNNNRSCPVGNPLRSECPVGDPCLRRKQVGPNQVTPSQTGVFLSLSMSVPPLIAVSSKRQTGDTALPRRHCRISTPGRGAFALCVILAHAVILEGALIRSRRRRQSAVKEARHRQPGYQLQSPRPLPLVQDPRYRDTPAPGRSASMAPPQAGLGTDCLRARGSIATSRRVGINFAFVISSQWCACRCTACAYSLSELFYRGRHGQESEEGKEDR